MKDTLLIANQGRSEEALAAFDRAAEIYEALVRRPGNGSEAHADVFRLGRIEGARALVDLKRGDWSAPAATGWRPWPCASRRWPCSRAT